MGALYKTASPETVDFMYQLPQEQLIAAMKVNEQNIDTQYQQAAVLNDQLLKLKSLAADQPEVKAYLDEMEEKVNSLTKTLQNDPMAWKKQMPLVRDLGQQIQKDFTRGKAAHWQSQYDAFQAADAKEKARIGLPSDKGGITPEQYTAWKNYTLSGFKEGSEYDDATGAGKSIAIEDLYANQDLNALLLKYSNDIKESSKKQIWDTIKGGYVTKYVVDGEYVTEDQIDQLAINTLMADQNVMGQLKQGHKMGYMRGVFDDNGQFINPIGYVDEIDPKTGKPTGNKVSRLNYNSPLAPAIAALRAREVYTKTNKETTRTADEFAKIAATGEEARKTDKAKYDREHPQNNITPLTFELGEKILNPEEFTPKNLTAIVDKYKTKDPTTAAEWTEYYNAKIALRTLEDKAKKELKLTDSQYEEMRDYLEVISNGSIPPTWKQLESGNYDKEMWSWAGPKAGWQKSAGLLDAEKKFKSLGLKKEDIAKVFSESNITKVPYFSINTGTEASESDKLLSNIGIRLAKSSNDIGFFDPKKNSEWGNLSLRFDTDGGLYSKNGKWFSNDEEAITTPAQMSDYLIPAASTPKGDDYVVIYKIDKAKLAAEGRVIESGEGGNPDFVKVVFNKTNANTIVREGMKNATPTARKVLDRDNPQAMYIVSQTGSQIKDLENNVMPTVFPLTPNSDRFLVDIVKNNSEEIKYKIADLETKEVKTYNIFAQKTPYGIVPPSLDVLNSRLIDASEILSKAELTEKEKKNTVVTE